MEDYLAERLQKYPHEGIGEFHIHSLDVSDEPLFRKVIEMAKARDIYLHVHSGPEPIRWLYGLDRDVKIIWAHAGLGEQASVVYDLMVNFRRLLQTRPCGSMPFSARAMILIRNGKRSSWRSRTA